MIFWKFICQLNFLTVALGLLGNPCLALGEGENPGKPLASAATSGKDATSAMVLQTDLNRSLSVQGLGAMERLLSPSKIQVADLSQEAKNAKSLFDQLQSQGKVLSTLTNSALQSLPIAVPIDNTSQGYLMIRKATFYPDHVELDVYARLLLGDQEIYFGATKVKYVMASGMAGTVGLVMLGTQEFSNTQYKVSLTGGSMNTTPSANASQLKINCGSFAGIVLKGKLELNKNTFSQLDDKGYPMNKSDAMASVIDFQSSDLSNLTIRLKDKLAFTLKKSAVVMGFALNEVYFDLSEKATPSAITPTVQRFFGANTDIIKQWTGLYATASTVYLPLYFTPTIPANATLPPRASFQAGTFLLDESGMYMTVAASNVASFDEIGGSPLTIDKVSFTLSKNTYSVFTVSGKIGVPLSKSPLKKSNGDYSLTDGSLQPDEYLSYTGSLDDKSQSFSLKMNQKDNKMTFLGGKSTLSPDSKIDFAHDSPNYRNRRSTLENPDSTATSQSGAMMAASQETPTPLDFDAIMADSLPGLLSYGPDGKVVNVLQARLVTPKFSFRYVIGFDKNSKAISNVTSNTTATTESVVNLGVIYVQDLVVGYSFLSKRPIFTFTSMGYLQPGMAPVVGPLVLKKLTAGYDDSAKECTMNLTFYATPSFKPKESITGQSSNAVTGAGSNTAVRTNTTTVKSNTATTALAVIVGVNVVFDWEVTDAVTTGGKFRPKAQFKAIELSDFQITNGDMLGLTLTGSIHYGNDDEDYGQVCTGNLRAEFRIKGLKKFAKSSMTGDGDSPSFQINWIIGKANPGTEDAYCYAYMDVALSFGEGRGVGLATCQVNGFGLGFAANMYQTNEFDSRVSLTGKKFLPRKGVYGGLFSIALIDAAKTQRGSLGIYCEGAKGEGLGGFRRLSLFGTWEFARDASSTVPNTPQDALKQAAGGVANLASPPNNASATTSGATPTNATGATNGTGSVSSKQLTSKMINNALKLLDVPLDDDYAVIKFDLTIDCSTDDLIIEGNCFGFMYFNLTKKDGNNKRPSHSHSGSYVKGAADDQGVGLLGMINFKIVVQDAVKEYNEKKEAKKNGNKFDGMKNPASGHFWLGLPSMPLAIEAMIALGDTASPNYITLNATFFMVGGNNPLPSNEVVYCPQVEQVKDNLNAELISRGDRPLVLDLPPAVMNEGVSYFSMGGSLGGNVMLTTPTGKVGAYANLSLGFGFLLAWTNGYKTCNGEDVIGSGVISGSGELGIFFDVKGSRTKFAILKGTISAGGVTDFVGNYGAVKFEYEILGGMIEGHAFMTYGNSPCLSPITYAVDSKVNLVKATTPRTTIIKEEPNARSEYREFMIQRHEMIVLHTDPQISLYEYCNITLDGQAPIENVMIAVNYYSTGSDLRRYRYKQPKNQVRFIANNGYTDIYTDTKKSTHKYTSLHKGDVELLLHAELVITDGSKMPNSSAWAPLDGTDFKQIFEFRTHVWDRYNEKDALPFFDDDGSSVGPHKYLWLYVRNLN